MTKKKAPSKNPGKDGSERSTRFKKWQPSPFKGLKRPHLPPTNGECFRKVAFEYVWITEGGVRRRIERFSACFRKIQDIALSGDAAAHRLLSKIRAAFPGKNGVGEPLIVVVDEQALKVGTGNGGDNCVAAVCVSGFVEWRVMELRRYHR